MAKRLRVAVHQALTTDDAHRNAALVRDGIDRAAAEGAAVLVTPECILSGYPPPEEADYDLLHSLIPDLARHAATQGLALALGCAVREDGKIYNRALLFDRRGELLGHYDKVGLTGFPHKRGDHAVFAPGTRLPVFELEGLPVGMQICFDMRFPENWRILRNQGARLVLHLSSASRSGDWKRPVLAGTMACRAAENGFYIASANDARAPQMMVSTINNPHGLVLAEAPPDEEALLVADLDFSDEILEGADWIYGARPVEAWRGERLL